MLLIGLIYDELMEQIGEKSMKLNFLPFNFFNVRKNCKTVLRFSRIEAHQENFASLNFTTPTGAGLRIMHKGSFSI